jgi:hypothetical protein
VRVPSFTANPGGRVIVRCHAATLACVYVIDASPRVPGGIQGALVPACTLFGTLIDFERAAPDRQDQSYKAKYKRN